MKNADKNKAILEAPEREGKRAFMYPANKEHQAPITIWAKSQGEADAEYTKIIRDKIKA